MVSSFYFNSFKTYRSAINVPYEWSNASTFSTLSALYREICSNMLTSLSVILAADAILTGSNYLDSLADTSGTILDPKTHLSLKYVISLRPGQGECNAL